jgi:methylmalonyl-CoA/ethylmalonyl-CoA epimerase
MKEVFDVVIKIKRIKRIAVAVKDLNKAVETWKRLFGIEPFAHGIQEDDKYEWVAFKVGQGECTMEFLAPYNDPTGEVLIGKFIRERGEGLYMVTLETEGTPEEVRAQIRDSGIMPSWGGQMKQWTDMKDMVSWTENYISPKYTHGVLITLASIEYRKPEIEEYKPGKTLPPPEK